MSVLDLRFASEELRGNKEVVLEAVKQNGRTLEYASEELRGDKEVVLEAVKQNGRALEYASEELRGDKEVVLEAVKQNRNAVEYAIEDSEVIFDELRKTSLEEIKEKFYKSIKEKVDERLTEEQIRGIVEEFDLIYGNIPEIITTTDPYEFEKETRNCKSIFEHSWAGSREYTREADVLIGDYEPGIDDVYDYSENGDTRTPKETYEMSDFSVNQIQVAIIMESDIDNFNGNDIDEYRESVQIYLPEEREYPENMRFKQMALEKRKTEFYKAIKEKVGEKLTDEQIRKIIEKFDLEFDLEDGNIPEIITTTNPHEFEENTRRYEDIFDHSWAGDIENIKQTDVVIGDYKPGIDDVYNYSENGDTRTPKETHEMSDFSVDQIQVAVVQRSYNNHFDGNDIDEYEKSVQIYLPQERKYSENVSFKQMILEKRKTEFYKAIKEKVGEKLTDEQIRRIIEKFDLEDGNIPEIITTTNPYEFEKNTKRYKNIFEHSWAGSREYTTETDVLIGDYEPGIDDIYEYSENGDKRTPEENHEMSDFSVNQIQATVVRESYINHFNGSHINEYKKSVQIYLPEERKYPENVRFKQINGKSDLAKRNEQLTGLEEEARKISEAEALIEQQKAGQNIGE